MLFLIQDFQHDDMPPVYTYPSGYSALLALGAEVRESLDQTLVGDVIKDKLKVSPEQARAEFAGDPIGFLKDLGARISDNRVIQTMYRVRATLIDCSPSPRGELSRKTEGNWDCYSGVTTIGYPIVIADGHAGAII